MGKNDFYKESIYLADNDSDAIRYIGEMRDIYNSAVLESIALYNSNITAYNQFIKRVACLVEALNVSDNAITASIIIDLLIKAGVFSAYGEYNKGMHTNQQVMGAFGIDVVNGTGVCRNTTSFLSDVLNKMNIMSYPFYCYATDDILDDANDHESNHVVNLIEYNGTLYGYDAFNSMLFKFVSDREMVQMFSEQPLKLYYKPYIDVVIEGLTLGNTDNLMVLFDNVKDNQVITLEEFRDMWKYAGKAICENAYLIGLFKENSKKRIREITKGLN